jgi:hypothetical protein
MPHRLVACAVATLMLGCASERVVTEHVNVRRHLLGLYEEQIQDNLARIAAGQAFVHLNYSEIKGASKDQLTGKVSHNDNDTDDVVGSNNLIVEGLDSDGITVSAEGTFLNEMSLKGEPLLGNQTVYDAYVHFSDFYIKRGNQAPAEVLWSRKLGSITYWMDSGTELAFRRLVLLTTLDQGKSRQISKVAVRMDDRGRLWAGALPVEGDGYLLVRPKPAHSPVVEFVAGVVSEEHRMEIRCSLPACTAVDVLLEKAPKPPPAKPTEVTVSGPGLAVTVK